MQKLVTIYLQQEGYQIQGRRSPEQSHVTVQEHLGNYLAEDWSIKSIAGVGGGGAGLVVVGLRLDCGCFRETYGR